MKKIILFLTISALLIAITPLSGFQAVYQVSASDYQASLKREYTLLTSYDPKRYSIINFNGDVITAEGFYLNDEVSKIEIGKKLADVENFDDGSYRARFEGKIKDDYAFLRIRMKSGVTYSYRIEYAGEWFFGDNGLPEANDKLIYDYIETPMLVTAQYLVNEDGDYNDAVETLNKISELALEITDGLSDYYDKARAISDWVGENIYYDLDAKEDDVSLDTIALNNVLETRKTVCSGYANLTAALMQAVGINSVTVIGNAYHENEYELVYTMSQHHEWTAFEVPRRVLEHSDSYGNFAVLDAGWDSGNYYRFGKYNRNIVAKRYFDITALALSQNHRAERAEYRDYFAVPEFLANGSVSEPPETFGETKLFRVYDDALNAEASEELEASESPETSEPVKTPETVSKTPEEKANRDASEAGENSEEAETSDNRKLDFLLSFLIPFIILALVLFAIVIIRKKKK